MPVNMDPKKRRSKTKETPQASTDPKDQKRAAPAFGEETEEDKEKELADAEKKNLWDATEVIDMDKW